jgi:DNA-binding response OmpR family regulator
MASVLVVEDNADLREMYHEILAGMGGHSVRVAEAAAEAVAAFAVERPRVVLLDLGIVGGVGSVLAAVRDGGGTWVILASGARDLPDVAASLGVAGYLQKPFTPEELVAAVEKVASY